MEASHRATSTDIKRQEGQYSLIHIPLPLYTSLLQPILQILLPGRSSPWPEDGSTHDFLNISITPLECSVVCLSSLAQTTFGPLFTSSSAASISKDTYSVFSVSSAGMEAGQRVMDLTAPLAMAGVPIFFITTYYTDFILIPSASRSTVIATLLQRGFVFSESDAAYVAPSSMSGPSHSRGPSVGTLDPPNTPPPENVSELQSRTFKLLRKRSVRPFVVPDLHLVQCSGKDTQSNTEYTSPVNGNAHGDIAAAGAVSWYDHLDAKLYLALISALVQQPRFLSITLTHDDAPSLLLDKTLLPIFGDTLAGDTDGDLVPIFLDLNDLPAESTGIVCGVAGKVGEVLRSIGSGNGNGSVGGGGGEEVGSEVAFLSTARAGAVVLGGKGSVLALEALGPLLEEQDSG